MLLVTGSDRLVSTAAKKRTFGAEIAVSGYLMLSGEPFGLECVDIARFDAGIPAFAVKGCVVLSMLLAESRYWHETLLRLVGRSSETVRV